MSRYWRIISTLSCVVLMSSLIGCTTMHMSFGKKIPKATAADPAVEILCLWQLSEGRDPEGYPCKGFSGQILFLSSHSSSPVEIEGDVRIYLFDDQGSPEEQAKPLRQFDFDNGSWAIHLADSPLGPAYSVFIPYVRRGTTDANCSLRVRLKPKQGPVVFSDFSNMALNGSKKPLKGEDAKPISKEEVDKMAADAMASTLRRTTTISMDPKAKSVDIATESKPPANTNQVQLASHEVPTASTKESADAERIRRLEAMVQQLVEQKNEGSPRVQTSSADYGIQPAELEDDASQPTERLKVDRRRKLRRYEESESSETPVRRRAHPLDEDQPSSQRSAKRFAQEPDLGDPFDSAIETTSIPRYTRQDQRYQRLR